MVGFFSFGITLNILNFYFLCTVSVLESISYVLFTVRGFEGCCHI